YKVARKHAGGAGEDGFAIAMPTLFEKSGAEGQYRRFKFEISAIVKRNDLPGYSLELVEAANSREPLLLMKRQATQKSATPKLPVAPQVEPKPTTAIPAPAASDQRMAISRSNTGEPRNYV